MVADYLELPDGTARRSADVEEKEISQRNQDSQSSIVFFGRPRGRNVDSSLSFLAVACCHDSEPKERHRTTAAFTVSFYDWKACFRGCDFPRLGFLQ